MESRPSHLSAFLLAALFGLGVSSYLPGVSAATANSAGAVLVRPGIVTDASGTGTPPLPGSQDGDGFPDTDETVDLSVLLSNKSPEDLTNVAVRLWTTDSRIACISNALSDFGSVAAAATVPSSIPFRFRVAAAADRGGTAPAATCLSGACSNGAGACAAATDCARSVLDVYAARFHATVTADQLPLEGETDSFEIELDLNAATAAAATVTSFEGFESGLAGMAFMNLDANLATNALSDGKRCQYNDPDFPNSESFGSTECYLGFVAGQQAVNDWHLHTTGMSDGGRARSGSNSLHWGLHSPGNPGADTYRLSQMDAMRTKDPIHLAAGICRDDPAAGKRSCNTDSDCAAVGGGPCVSANPELSFVQQISSMDYRGTATPVGQAADRGVVHAQIDGSSVWQKIYPYSNVYDAQGTDQFVNCTFDPDDDGNNEDDYFDPDDPDRRYGPSSTCFPEWAFSYLGDTDEPYAASKIGRASDGPGLPGSLGVGTWVESKYSLPEYRGRAIRLRWLFTSIKVSDVQTAYLVFMWNPTPSDDGWYVDDVRVTQTLGASLPTATLDSADRSALPACAAGCTSVTAALTAAPSPSLAPGAPVTFSAAGSVAGACPGEALLYEYGVDGDGDGSLGSPADWIVSGPSLSSQATVEVIRPATYGVRVRCASNPSCSDDQTVPLDVQCPPAQSYNPSSWWARLRLERRESGNTFIDPYRLVTNDAHQTGDVVYGSLAQLRFLGSFNGPVVTLDCLQNDWSLDEVTLSVLNPSAGYGYWFLMRGTEPWCNEPETWSTYHPQENPGDPGKRDREITVCPGPPPPAAH